MSQEPKLELPSGWKKFNLYSLHLCYIFALFCLGLKIPGGAKSIIKTLGQNVFDLMDTWSFILFIVTGACSGILGYVKTGKFKKILGAFDNDGTDTGDR